MGEILGGICEFLLEVIAEPLLEFLLHGWRIFLALALGGGLAFAAYRGLDAGTLRATIMTVTTLGGLVSGVFWQVQA